MAYTKTRTLASRVVHEPIAGRNITYMLYIEHMISFREVKKELLKNPAIRKEYERLEPQFEIAVQLLDYRIKHNLSQAQLAKKLGTKQSAVARLESGNDNPTVKQLQKIADALNAKLVIKIS